MAAYTAANKERLSDIKVMCLVANYTAAKWRGGRLAFGGILVASHWKSNGQMCVV